MKKLLFLLLTFILLPLHTPAQPVTYILRDNWKAKRVTDVIGDGTEITGPGFKTEGWIDAVVPGTILTTLLHNNQIPDPFFGLNNNLIPDVFSTGRDYYTYWFYNEFEIPEAKDGQEVWLNFRGINYFADIFLNGKRVNTRTHEGMYLREKYLITPFLNKGKLNKLAVWVAPPDPVGNAAAGQGGDGTIGRNVTMQCTAGWDWICPMRDRNTGIWDQVSVDVTGAVDIRNPFVTTRVPGIRVPGQKQAPAFVNLSADLKNVSSQIVQGTLKIELEGYRNSIKVILNPFEEKTVTVPEIKIETPLLWWPNGLGDHPLYLMKIDFASTDKTMDSEQISFGIRDAANYFDEKIKSRVFTVNGQKVFIKGGNWIASDAMLRLSKERYDAEVRFHAEMNMNMIRVWGGGLTERPEFYEACDRYGILVWQDLWVSGDCNGEWLDPQKKESQARRKAYPDNHSLFLESAIDQIKMLRNHPSLYLWCGGNETLPPADILTALEKEIFPRFDPGRYFLEMSTSSKLMTNTIGGVGDGPYGIREPEKIFTERSFPFNPETGSIGIPNYDNLKKIIPEDEMIPPAPRSRESKSWTYHKYLPLLDFPDRYGKVKDIRDFCLKAQIVSYEQYRALQEGFNYKMWDWYSGMLVWKNQNPWTALRGGFYDYYLDYTGGYFGYKHGAAPVHIQLNLNDSVVCVLNQTADILNSLTAYTRLYDLHGKLLSEQKSAINMKAHDMILLNKIDLPVAGNQVFFLKLQLMNGAKVVDENLYWLTNKPKSYEKLNDLKQVTVNASIKKSDTNHAVIKISNPGTEPAFFIRLKIMNKNDELVLPSFFTDNYFTLMPGDEKQVELDLPADKSTTSLNELKLVYEGWNVLSEGIKF
jgi:hypothetical protein